MNLLNKIEQVIKGKMNGVCEGAIIMVNDYYGTYFWNYKDHKEAVTQIENLRKNEHLECEMKLTLHLVPKGEGYKNFNNQYANMYDWLETFDTYNWLKAHEETVK